MTGEKKSRAVVTGYSALRGRIGNVVRINEDEAILSFPDAPDEAIWFHRREVQVLADEERIDERSI